MERLEGVIITDEKTMMQEEIDELRAQLSNARKQIAYLKNEVAGRQSLVDMMTDASTRGKRQIKAQAVRHQREMAELVASSKGSVVAAGLICGTAGFLICGLLVWVCYMITRFGW